MYYPTQNTFSIFDTYFSIFSVLKAVLETFPSILKLIRVSKALKSLNFSVIFPKWDPFFTTFHPLQTYKNLINHQFCNFLRDFWEVFAFSSHFHCYESLQSHFSLILTGFSVNFDWMWMYENFSESSKLVWKLKIRGLSKLFWSLTGHFRWKSNKSVSFFVNSAVCLLFQVNW